MKISIKSYLLRFLVFFVIMYILSIISLGLYSETIIYGLVLGTVATLIHFIINLLYKKIKNKVFYIMPIVYVVVFGIWYAIVLYIAKVGTGWAGFVEFIFLVAVIICCSFAYISFVIEFLIQKFRK